MEIITSSEKETFDFAKKFAKTLRGGEIIGLIGELGAGKTVFTKGLAAGLGIKTTVNSPTFVLMKIYLVKNHKTIKKFVHMDAYRINNESNLLAIGVKDFLGEKNTVTVIEWFNIIKKLSDKIIIINIRYLKNNRIISY